MLGFSVVECQGDSADGNGVGTTLGLPEGTALGTSLGISEGTAVGEAVGCVVTTVCVAGTARKNRIWEELLAGS